MREFRDERGRSWIVWEVLPTALERKLARRRGRARAAGIPERPISEHLQTGWLAFESGADRRRLAPPPENWADASDERLRELLGQAQRVARSRRLIE